MESPERRGKARWLAIAVVITVAALLRTMPAPHWVLSDAENYSAIAWRMSRGAPIVGQYAGPPHKPTETMGPRAFAIRPGVTAPASLAFRLMPAGGWAAAAYPLVLGLSEVLLAYFLGRRLAGETGGIVAAAMVATIPQAVIAGRTLMADMPAAVFAGWAVLAFLAATAAKGRRTNAAHGVVAGLLLGCSWLAKETVVLMIPAMVAIAVFATANDRRARIVAVASAMAAFAGVVLCESIVYRRLTGDMLFRVHELARNFEQCRENFWYQASPAGDAADLGIGGSIVQRLLVTGPASILLTRPSFGIVSLALGAAALGRWRGVRLPVLPLAWLCALGIAFNFGSTSATEYRPLPPFSNYLYPLLLPGCLVVAGVVAAMSSRSVPARQRTPTPRGQAIPVHAVVGVLVLGYTFASVAVNRRNAQASSDLADAAAILPPSATVVSDCGSVLGLSLFATGVPDVAPGICTLGSPGALESAEYLVLAPERLRDAARRYGCEPPDGVRCLADWDPILVRPTLTVFVRRAGPAVVAASR